MVIDSSSPGKMFSSAQAIERIVWQMRQADYPRSSDRARIASLANGAPPYSVEDELKNKIEVNVNDLSLTRLSHEARLQLYQGFNKPGNFFTARTDSGAATRRGERGAIFTKEISRIMKKSDDYFECQCSKIGGVVLHGIGPANWENEDSWCPIPLAVGDVLIPEKTLRSFRNLPFFAIYRSYSPHELMRLARRASRTNPGWNMDVVERAVKWSDEQTARLQSGGSWSEYWRPEDLAERIKENSGVYASDLVQSIDCFDFYYLDDAKKTDGWRRRIIFDGESGAKGWMDRAGKSIPSKNLIGEDKGSFLFDSGDRVVASRIGEIVHFMFGDLAAVTPARYHSQRGLGFMLYAVCHLQNRTRCKISEAVFENLMRYFRVNSTDEYERALAINLITNGFLDPSVQFVSPQERHQPDAQLVMAGLNEFKQIIADNSSSFVQNHNMSRDRVEKTAFQVQAEVNAMMTLVSAALQQAYRYQTSEYVEIVRRFLKKGSSDPDVNVFRARCLSQGIPEKYLEPGCWDIEPERIMGSGNKTLEMAIAKELMDRKAAYAAESQEEIVRMFTLAITDDAAKTEALVPFKEGVSDDRHDAMTAFGSLMAGAVIDWRRDQNRLVVVQMLLAQLKLTVEQVKGQLGGMTSLDKVLGMQNVLNHIARLVVEIGKDKQQKELAKALAQESGNLANEVKGFAQRVQEQMKAQGDGGENGKAQLELMKEVAKFEIQQQATAAKQENTRMSHAQRTAQRQAQAELKTDQDEQKHAQQLKHKSQDHALEIAVAASMAEIEKKRANDKPAGGGEE